MGRKVGYALRGDPSIVEGTWRSTWGDESGVGRGGERVVSRDGVWGGESRSERVSEGDPVYMLLPCLPQRWQKVGVSFCRTNASDRVNEQRGPTPGF